MGAREGACTAADTQALADLCFKKDDRKRKGPDA